MITFCGFLSVGAWPKKIFPVPGVVVVVFFVCFFSSCAHYGNFSLLLLFFFHSLYFCKCSESTNNLLSIGNLEMLFLKIINVTLVKISITVQGVLLVLLVWHLLLVIIIITVSVYVFSRVFFCLFTEWQLLYSLSLHLLYQCSRWWLSVIVTFVARLLNFCMCVTIL